MFPEEDKPVVLVVDDEIHMLESFELFLEHEYRVIKAKNADQALKKVQSELVDVILLDIKLPDTDGITLLRKIKEIDCGIEVVMVTALNTVKLAVESIKIGAYDYVTKPFDSEELLALLRKVMEKRWLVRERAYLKMQKGKPFFFKGIIGISESMREICELVADVGNNDSSILIDGESGTGKELVARAIHVSSNRRDRAFVPIDCAALPENLIESELFGHEAGAFTGATKQKIGRLELADRGTLFLDEVGNLELSTQVKLLRVLQERAMNRVGGLRSITFDTRLITATNVSLKEGIKEGWFREDLYYRINVIPLKIPPLRDRIDDIPILIAYFLPIYNQTFNKRVKTFSRSALKYMLKYNWPGNVRELQNVVERAVALSKKSVITQEQLPLDLLAGYGTIKDSDVAINGDESLLFREARMEFERQFIIDILKKTKWNQSKAARMIGLHRNSLNMKMRELGIKPMKGVRQN